nr:rod shape-determining protein MreC [Candidatus Levybacteria bacterium]
MQKRSSYFLYFIIFFCISLLLLFSSKVSFLKPVNSIVQVVFAPVQSLTYGIYSSVINIGSSSKLKLLEDENRLLIKKLADLKKVEGDNKALQDQFQTVNIRSTSLLPAGVIGAPGLIPGISVPETLTLNRGQADGVKVGQAVIYKDNLIGKVIKTSNYLSSVLLITNSSSSFTASSLETNALGVVKGGGGGGLIFDNILLSESLKKDDLVVTKGDVNQKGEGFPKGLIVGKIASVSKNASDLFQKAKVKQLVDLTKLNAVFIIINP